MYYPDKDSMIPENGHTTLDIKVFVLGLYLDVRTQKLLSVIVL